MLHILTDGISDILPIVAHEMDVTVIPLTVQIDDETFLGGVTIDNQTFYEKMRNAKALPKTSQASPAAFQDAFEKVLQDEDDEAIAILGSSVLSGTFQSAVIAKNSLDKAKSKRLFLIDSMSATIGQSVLVYSAVSMKKAGETCHSIVQKIEALKSRIAVSAVVGDLKYLVMGGRLSATGSKVGGLLKLKPMVRIMEGTVKTAGVCRSKKVLDWLVDDMKKASIDPDYPMIFGNADCAEAMLQFKDFCKAKGILAKQTTTMEIGSVIGSHAGPGAFGVAWIKKA